MSNEISRPGDLSDGDLRDWMDVWKGGDVGRDGGLDAEERQRLRARARRSTLQIGALVATEILMAVGIVAWSLARAIEQRAPQDWALFAIILGLVVGVFAVSMWNRRGTWRPYDRSSRAYLGLEILRVRRKLITTTRILPAVLAIEIALLLPWKIWTLASDPEVGSLSEPILPTLFWLTGISIAVLSIARLFTHRFRADLERLSRLQASLDDPDIEARL